MANNPMSKLDSYALMIIALSALFVSVWQVNLQRKHDRISVMPYLEWKKEKDSDGYTMLKVKNKGFGPAIFQSGHLDAEGRQYRDWKKALANLDTSIDVSQSTVFGQFTLLPGEEVILVTAKGGEKVVQFAFQVAFKDVYDNEYDDQYQHTGYPFR